LCCLAWIVIYEKQGGKEESLNHYWIIMDVAKQKALQQRPHNMHKIDFLLSNVIQQRRNTQLH
jgi:hypothetical protein